MADLTPLIVVLSAVVLLLAAAVVALARRPANSYSETYNYGAPPGANDFLVNHDRAGRLQEYDREDYDDDCPTF